MLPLLCGILYIFYSFIMIIVAFLQFYNLRNSPFKYQIINEKMLK